MKTISILLAIILSSLNFISQASDIEFEKFFKDKTMRFDYYHTGTAVEEHFAFDQIVSDGMWGGSTTQLIDKLNLGKYQYQIIDSESGMLIYSKGFASIYGEWETTPEAKEQWGVFHESVRFPWPVKEVKLIILKRGDNFEFEPIYEYLIKPNSHKINPVDLTSSFKVYDVIVNGDPKTKVDIVLLGEGYTADEMGKFHADAEEFANALFSTEPFKSRKMDFNIRAVEVPAPNSGCNHPHQDIYKRTATSVSYSAFDSERYALGYDNKKIRDIASTVPYENMAILMNDSIYGGGGIYNLYITAASDNAFHNYLFVHEFGHHLADLADEYYTSSTAYEMGSTIHEPWELNVTAQTDRDKIKWADMIDKDTPIPTPWNKEEFDNHSIEIQKKRKDLRKVKANEKELETLFKEQQKYEDDALANEEYAGKVGAFEGAQYHQYGLYRSAPNCIMYTRTNFFCPACQRAINLVIDTNVK
jgi:IgA peptidase M64/peptidase M64-like protein